MAVLRWGGVRVACGGAVGVRGVRWACCALVVRAARKRGLAAAGELTGRVLLQVGVGASELGMPFSLRASVVLA